MESLMGGVKHPINFYPLLKQTMVTKKTEKQILANRGFCYSMLHEVSRNFRSVLKHPDELYPLLKLKMAAKKAEKPIRRDGPHWEFCYSILPKVSNSLAYRTQQLSPELRDAACILYLVLRALDTIEDDPSIATEIKEPILRAFHRHIYDHDWHFSCGKKYYKVLMDQFHHVRTAFLELNKSQREVIEDTTMKMGSSMANFLQKEVETVEDLDEYCHYSGGIVYIAYLKLFYPSATDKLCADSISSSTGLFYTKVATIRDYLEDINEIPKLRMFWPRQIWSKYVNRLEDLKDEENSEKAVQCVNDMVTNTLIHTEDCLNFMSHLHDPTILRFFAIPQIMAFGSLTLFYNNIHFFKGVVNMRPGLTTKVSDRTKTMADVYGAFYDFSLILKSKIDMKDPNAKITMSRIEVVQKICTDSGTIFKRESSLVESNTSYNQALWIALLIITLAVLSRSTI